MIRRVGALMVLTVLALGVACSADRITGPATYEVALAVDSVAIRAGDSIVPVVRVTVNGVPRTANAREVLVSSSDTSVIVVAANGALIAVGHGSSTITVRWVATSSIAAARVVTVVSEDLNGVTLAAPVTMVPGDTGTLVVTGRILAGRTIPNPASVSVISRNPAVATAGGGEIVAIATGTTWVVATGSTGVSDSSLVTVAVGVPTHISIVPRTATITAGLSLATTVTMTDRRNNPVTNSVPSYLSSSTAIATVQADGTVNGMAGGSALVIVQAGVAADTLRLTVTPAPPVLTRLVASPDSVTLTPGGAAPIQVQALDATGNPMPLPTLVWQSLTNGITVSSTGVIQAASSISSAIADGAVKASSGGIVAQVRVAVIIPPPVLAQLIVSPDSVTLTPGATAQIQVQARDTRGNPMPLPALTWQSQTSGITVTGAGLIQAASGIGATIANGAVRVSSGAIASTVRVAVIVAPAPPPPSDSGYVQIRWIGDPPSPAVAAAFEAARARINGLFKSFNGVNPLDLDIPADLCMTGTPALTETVRGLVIFAQVTPIDGVGRVLGSAGPCLVRTTTWLPVVGTMRFDSADMDGMLANGLLYGVLLHEMMHTLGFGTIWGPDFQGEVAAPYGNDPRYLGINGQAGYAAAGGTDPNGVPVENTGGAGTQGAHWRELNFRTELMTGWADGAMPMSRATIGVLRDLGYDVDLNKADPFTLPGTLVGAGLRASQQIVEQANRPLGSIGPGGKITPLAGGVIH